MSPSSPLTLPVSPGGVGDGHAALRGAPDPAGTGGHAAGGLEGRGVLPEAPVEQAAGDQRESPPHHRPLCGQLLPADTKTNTAGLGDCGRPRNLLAMNVIQGG